MSALTAKLTLSLARSLFTISLLGLAFNPLSAFQQSAAKKTKYEFTDTRISEADSLLSSKQYQAALEAYEKVYALYENDSFYEGMVYAKERMGYVYRRIKKDSLSIQSFNEANLISRNELGENHPLESKVYLNNGIRAHFARRPILASRLIDTAKYIYDRSGYYDSATLRSIVDFKFYTYFYSNLGNDTLVKYLDEKSRYYEKESVTVNQQVFLFSDYNRAFYTIGDFQKAVAYGLEAVRVAEQNLEKVSHSVYGDALWNLGRSLHSQRDFEQALSISTKLIEFTTKNDPDNTSLPTYKSLRAVVLNGLGRYPEAADEFKSIIKMLEPSEINTNFYRTTIQNLGVSYQKMGEFELSLEYLKRALRLQKEHRPLYDLSFVNRYRYLGHLYSAMEIEEMSLKYYDSALRSAVSSYKGAILEYPTEEPINATYDLLSIIRNKQLAFDKLYTNQDLKDSTSLLYSAIEYAEYTHEYLMNNRRSLQASSGKLLLSDDFKNLYESAMNAIYLLLEKENNDSKREVLIKKAARFLALSKSNLFLEQAGEFGKVRTGVLSEDVTQRYYELKSEIGVLEKKFYDLFDQISSSDSLRLINSRLMLLNAELTDLVNMIQEGEEELRNEEGGFDKINEVLSGATNRKYVEFFVGERFTFVLSLSKKRQQLSRIDFGEDLKTAFDRVVSHVSKRPMIDSYNSDLVDYKVSANRLYNALLRDALEGDPMTEEIIIVPDEILSKLPFEVLVQSISGDESYFYELNYLIKKYDIRYALSSNELTIKSKKRIAEKEFLGIGFSGSTPTDNRSEAFGALPGTEEEIKFLKSRFDGDYLLGMEGTKTAFLKKAKDYDVLHLAVHGSANNTSRFESNLIFNGNSDNVLNTNDLYAANLNARLAVLSACESGVGQINKGEGTFSIARGFAIVGVPSIVMSLWRVNDKIGSEIMMKFHKNFEEGSTSSQSLNQAKREFLLNDSDQYTSHPYYWSAFVPLGEDVFIDRSGLDLRLLIAILIIIATTFVIVTLIIRKRKRA